ncbi:MAG: alpha/beta fold hydrolase, partial [Acidobacteria bacterium]|nr:alpha/beta fold hydrolase [Acidobacteriota bacterium]
MVHAYLAKLGPIECKACNLANWSRPICLALLLSGCSAGPVPCPSLECEPLPGAFHVVNDVRIWVARHGQGEPVLLLHGIPTSGYLWRNVQRGLGSHFMTLAPDLMGLGHSDRPRDGGLSLPEQADTLRGLLDSLGISRIALVAHDVGGGVALTFASRYPERIRALVFMDVTAFQKYWPVSLVATLRVPVVGEIASLFPWAPILKSQLRKGLHRPELMTDAVFWHYYEPFSDLAGRFDFLAFVRALDPELVERQVRECASFAFPTLILWAEEDGFQPIGEGVELHRAWGFSRFKRLGQAGHFLQEDAPEAVAGEIARFLEDLSPGEAA